MEKHNRMEIIMVKVRVLWFLDYNCMDHAKHLYM